MAMNDVDREVIRLRAEESLNNGEIRAWLKSEGHKLGRHNLFTPEMVEECERVKAAALAEKKTPGRAYIHAVAETKKEAIARVEEILGEEFGTSVETQIAKAVHADDSGSAAFKIFEAKWGKADAKIVMEIAETRVLDVMAAWLAKRFGEESITMIEEFMAELQSGTSAP